MGGAGRGDSGGAERDVGARTVRVRGVGVQTGDGRGEGSRGDGSEASTRAGGVSRDGVWMVRVSSGVGLKFCEYTNMKRTPTRKDFDRFLQLRYDGVLDFNAYLRGWTKTWKKLAFYGGSTEETSPPPSPPPRTSTPGANNAPAEANFHRETALDFLRFGFHDALRPEEIGEQKERELRFFMDEVEAHWDLRSTMQRKRNPLSLCFTPRRNSARFINRCCSPRG